MSKPKQVNYELINGKEESGREVYGIIQQAVDQWHPHLEQAKILAAWNTGWKPDKDSKIVLGQCKKASDLSKELAEHDFIILLNKSYWIEFSVAQRTALIDHELSHAAISKDDEGATKYDDRGRVVYRTRAHDVEDFNAVVRRHGLWKSDLENFAKAIQDSKQAELFKAKGDMQITA